MQVLLITLILTSRALEIRKQRNNGTIKSITSVSSFSVSTFNSYFNYNKLQILNIENFY